MKKRTKYENKYVIINLIALIQLQFTTYDTTANNITYCQLHIFVFFFHVKITRGINCIVINRTILLKVISSVIT